MKSGRPNGVFELNTSPNWSGLVQPGTNLDGAVAEWTVPAVQPSSSALSSSTWVGVDGVLPDQDLIQTGTTQDTSDGYYAWWEILPAAEVPITDAYGNPSPVAPGDLIFAWVALASPGTWTIYLENITEGWYFQQNFSYGGAGPSAEWVEEAPTINGSIAPLADFGSVQFFDTQIYGNFGSGSYTWQGTTMDASNEWDMVDSTGTNILAYPSAPAPDESGGQEFTDTFGSPVAPRTPPHVHIASPQNIYQLSRTISVVYSGTDPASPVATYDVRYEYAAFNSEYLSNWVYPADWQGTTSRRASLVGSPGDVYCFSVRATSAAGVTSKWTSAFQCAWLPVGARSLRPATSGWSWHGGGGYYLNTYATTTTQGAELRLSGAYAGQLAVVATRCPTCGVVGVYVNQRFLGTVNTHASATVHGAFLYLPNFAYHRYTVTLVNESANARLIIEGLAVS